MATKDLDITKTGPLTYRQLINLNEFGENADNEGLGEDFIQERRQRMATSMPRNGFNPAEDAPTYVESTLAGTATPFGQSIFDPNSLPESEWEHAGDVRAENEPWYAKIGAGIAKGTITAVTTLIDGTLGLVDGLIEAVGTRDVSKLWDNTITNCMNEVSKWQEEALPNYYTEAEQNAPWWENLGTANFWGDNFIKNLGFTIGAFYGGAGWGGLLFKALPKLFRYKGVFNFINSASEASKATKSLVSAGISAVGEGSIEAINGRDEFIQNNSQSVEQETALRKQQALMEYENAKAEGTNISIVDGQLIDTAYEKYKQDIAEIDQARENALAKINEDATHVGNVILALNVPILTAGNLLQFGRIYAGGFDNARLGSRFKGGLRFAKDQNGKLTLTADYKPGTSKLYALLAAKGTLTEGNEEMAQKFASETAEDYYSTDVNAYYAKQFDPDASAETANWIKSAGRGLAKSYGDASAWEEGFIGGLTGTIGMPGFRSAHRTVKNADGTISKKWQSPVYMQEGLWGGIKNYREARAREKKIVDAINSHINDPNYLNLWRSFIRDKSFQNDMDVYALTGDIFNYKNAQFGQLVSDIELFKSMGKLDDLRELISQAADTSDESIDDIIANTTSTADQVQTEGHNYIDERQRKARNLGDKLKQKLRKTQRGKNNPTIEEEIPSADNKTSDVGPFVDQKRSQITQELIKGRDKLLKVIDQYSRTYDKVDRDTGGVLSDEQLKYLTQLRLQVDDWRSRGQDMAQQVRTAAIAVKENVVGRISAIEAGINSNKYNTQQKKERIYEKNRLEQLLNIINELENSKNSDIYRKLSLNKRKSFWNKSIDAFSAQSMADLMSAIYHYDGTLTDQIGNTIDKNDVIRMINDLTRVNAALELYNRKIDEYTGNTDKILTDQNMTKEEIAQAVKYHRKQMAYHATQGAKTTRELEDALDMNLMMQQLSGIQSDDDIKKEIVEDLAALGDRHAAELIEMDKYENDVRAEIDRSQASQEAKDAAHQLFAEHRDASPSLETLADPSLTFVTQDHFTSPLQEGERAEDKRLTDEYVEGLHILEQAKVRVNNAWDNTSRRFGHWFYVLPQGSSITAVVDAILANNKLLAEQETGNDKDSVTTVPPVNEGTTIEGEGNVNEDMDNSPIGTYKDSNEDSVDKDKEGVRKDNQDIDSNAISDDFPENNEDTPPRKMIITIIPYYDIDSKKNGIYVPFGRQQTHAIDAASGVAVSFSYIYNHLVNNGAFDYVDDGKLKVGDKVGFMIDPAFEKGKSSEEVNLPQELREEPTIFMVVKDTGQIIGVVPGRSSQSNYWGLDDLTDDNGKVTHKGLINNLLDEYNAWDPSKNEGKVFISDKYTTRVSQLMLGNIHYTNDTAETTINSNCIPQGQAPIFAVMTNDVTLRTNRPDLEGRLIEPIGDSANPGHIYLYVPNIRGTYSPVAIRAKRLSQSDFDIRDGNNRQNGTIGEEIYKLITELAKADNNDKVTDIWNRLKDVLYIENVKITYEAINAQGVPYAQPRINIDGIQRDPITGEELKEGKDRHQVILTGTEAEDVESILKVLEGFNLPIQIKASKINVESGYNDRLLSSGVLASNITEARMVGNWFATDYYNPETGKFETAERLPHKTSMMDTKKSSAAPTKTDTPPLPPPLPPATSANTDNGSVVPGIKIEGEFPLPASSGSHSYSGHSIEGTFYVDLDTHVVRNAKGVIFESKANDMMIDLAYLQSISEGNTEIPGMMHLSEKTGKVFAVINRGESSQRVINVTDRKYVYGKQADNIADWFTKQVSPKPVVTTIEQPIQTTPTEVIEEITSTPESVEENVEVVSLQGRQTEFPFNDTLKHGARVISEQQVTDFQIGQTVYSGRTFDIGKVGGFPIRMVVFKDQRAPLEGEATFGMVDVNMVYVIFPNGLAAPVYTNGIGDQELDSNKVIDDAMSMVKEGFESRPDDFKQLVTKETLVNKGQPQTKNAENQEKQTTKQKTVFIYENTRNASTARKKRNNIGNGLNQVESEPTTEAPKTQKNKNKSKEATLKTESKEYKKEENAWTRKTTQEWLQEGNELYAMYSILDQYGKQDPEFQKLFDKIRRVYEELYPLNRIFIRDAIRDLHTDVELPMVIGRYTNVNGGMLELRRDLFDSSSSDIQRSARIILHEMIHAVTSYALSDQQIIKDKLSPEQDKAVKELRRIYEYIRKDASLRGEYGITDIREMVAELSNPEFREKLKNIKLDKVSLWDRILNAIRGFFGIDSYEAVSSLLDDLLDNYDQGLANLYNTANTNTHNYSELSQESKESLERKGYTEDKFNSFPQGMRDHILRCIGF